MSNDDNIPPDATVAPETVRERWGSAADAGFVALPNALVRGQAKLGLSANEVVVLLNIMLHWWTRDRLPRPRSTAIAKRSGLGHRTVQRTLQSLEQKRLIARSDGPEGVPQYSLEGLREALGKVARGDAWYRPKTDKLSGSTEGAGLGFQNPSP
jgi:DNA-binding HxlR family transcriptional regulator